VGVSNPVQALEVAGSAVVAGTLSAGNPLMFRNRIINGNFDVWQRGTSFSSPATAAYTTDRWYVNYDGSGATRTISRQTFALGQTAVPGNPKYYLQWAQTVAGTGGTFNQLVQPIESVLTFAGQVVTVSFWAQASTGTPSLTLYTGQYFGTGGSPSAAVYPGISPTYTLSTSWQYFTWTTFLPSITGKTLGTNGDDYTSIAFRAPSNATGTWNIASVQVEAGSVATPFEVRPYATELALCQRYYEKSYNDGVNPGTNTEASLFSGFAGDTAGIQGPVFRVTKRAVPTMTFWARAGTAGNVSGWTNTATNTAYTGYGGNGANGCRYINATVTAGALYTYHWSAEAEI
jgi:hypothetical protein